MHVIISGVKRIWTLYFVYKKVVEEAIRDYPLDAYSF